MEVQPKGFNVVVECDVPFALPSDTRLYKNLKNHLIQRREIFSSFETTFNKYQLSLITIFFLNLNRYCFVNIL
jgi:hypothetical protein